MGTYVKNAKIVVDEEVDFPEGYSLVWSGQYEYMVRAQQRLRIVLPVTLVIIFLLLYLNFKNIQESFIVMLSMPFSLVGGIWFIYLLDYNLSVAVGVGFIALAGLSAEIGVIMLTYLDHAYNDRIKEGKLHSLQDLKEVILKATAMRIRPIVMTVSTTILGLLPIMWGHGAGSQVMKRIAAPMVGGLFSTTILCLLVIPTIYFLWRGRGLNKNIEDQIDQADSAVLKSS